MRRSFLESLKLPDDIAHLSPAQMRRLAQEVRDLIIEVVSTNGGHLAPSLGVVELTIALLAVLDLPTDKVIWDVGHQCYAYKILTDRLQEFPTLRRENGISGFPKPSESPYDSFATGHASTAISAALGIALARDLAGDNYKVVAVVGDGALGGGMAWEALNNAGGAKSSLLVILNDNKMSISPSTGGLSTYIARLRAMPLYRSVEDGAEKIIRRMPVGSGLISKTSQVLKRGLTNWVSPTSGTIFEALGFHYIGPLDGHDAAQLRSFLAQARGLKGPVLIHVVTTKGKGYPRAEHEPSHYHGIGPFNTSNGKVPQKPQRTYTDIFGSTLMRLARRDPRIVAITAAMAEGTGLSHFEKKYPSRFFNVGIAEAHAVTFAAGLASAGAKPVVAIYSTFLQRAYDQILHDVCMQNLPVVFALDRAGIVGEDGPTHHGAFDLSYLRHIPNLTVMVPRDAGELADMLYTAFSLNSPVAIRYPRGAVQGTRRPELELLPAPGVEMLRDGNDLAIIGIGPIINAACEAADVLALEGVQSRVINARFVRPLDEAAVISAARDCGNVLIVEENVGQGGFCGAVLECLAQSGVTNIRIAMITLPGCYLNQGSAADLRAECGLDSKGIVNAAVCLLSGNDTSQGDGIVIRQSI